MRSERVSRPAGTEVLTVPLDFTAVVREFEHPLGIFLTEMLGDAERARDVLQDTFCDAWKAFGQGSAPFTASSDRDGIRRWLFHVAYHRAISTLRRIRVIRWISLDNEGAPDLFALPDPQTFEDAVADRDLLDSALAHLSPEDVACLLLTIVHDFTALEAAQIMKASPYAVAKRLSRARRRLHKAYLAEFTRMQEDEHS